MIQLKIYVLFLTLFGLWLSALGTGGRASQDKSGKKSKSAVIPAPAGLLAEEKGRFRILLDGQTVGAEEFQISQGGISGSGIREWTARGSTEIRMPGGGTMRVRAQLALLPNGAPLRYEWSTQGEKKASAAVEFEGGTARMSLQMEGAQPFVQELSFASPRVLILDNNLYHHYAILARLYDWKTQGAQTFPVLIPQDMTPGSVTVELLGPASTPPPELAASGLVPNRAEGAEGLQLLRVRTADLEVNLYLDASHKLVRLAAPAAKVTVVRE